MRWTSAILVLTSCCPFGFADDPREIVAQGIAAHGGADKLRQIKAARIQFKGTSHELDQASIKGHSISAQPLRYKWEGDIVFGGNKIEMVTVLNGPKAWIRINQETEEADLAHYTELKQVHQVSEVARLLPLLDEPAFQLESLPPIAGAPGLQRVKVKREGYPEVTLGFDAKTHLLVKIEHQRKDATSGKLKRYEDTLSDYREIDSTSGSEQALREAMVKTDPESLLAFLRKLTLSDAERSKINGWIVELGDRDFEVREAAKRQLSKANQAAAPHLAKAAASKDPEVAGLARDCLDSLGAKPDPRLAIATARLLVRHRPLGAVEALLGYLPDAPDQATAQEAISAIATLNDGAPNPKLQAALNDPNPVRKAAAKAILQPDPKAPVPVGKLLILPGMKHFFKRTILADGKKYEEWEILDIELFRLVDESLFSKPG